MHRLPLKYCVGVFHAGCSDFPTTERRAAHLPIGPWRALPLAWLDAAYENSRPAVLYVSERLLAGQRCLQGILWMLKNEMFYGGYWEGVSSQKFISILDSYLHWYNRKRIKQFLGWRSPMNFRCRLGLVC